MGSGYQSCILVECVGPTCFEEDSTQASTSGLFLREPSLPECHVSLSDCATEVMGED